MPRMQPLDHPTTRLSSRMQGPVLIASRPWRDVSLVVLAPENGSGWLVVKGGVQTQMLYRGSTRLRSDNDLMVQQLGQRRAIIDIGRRHHDRQRHPATITQNVVFHPGFGAIRRVGAAFFFPPSANERRCRQPLAIASQCLSCDRTDAGNVARCLQRRRPVPIQRSGHKQFDGGRTLWAWRATERLSKGCKAYRRGVCDHQCVCDRHDNAAAAAAE